MADSDETFSRSGENERRGYSTSAGEREGPRAGSHEVTRQQVDAHDDGVETVDVKAIAWTIGIAAFFALAANMTLLVNYMHDSTNADSASDWNVPWQAPVAMALSVVSLVTFGGFYIAARRARIAMAASFLLTFLVMLPFALTIPEFGTGDQTALAQTLIDQFGGVVSTVIVFYFGSEAVITGLKLWTTAQNPSAAAVLARADRDLPRTRSTAGRAGR